jgi:hypothetical protein
MLNLSPLFYTTDENEACLYTALDLGMRPRNYIAEAKTDVRNCLRVGIPRVLKSNGYASGVPQPRFFTQGSWAYKTLNAPAQDPQQADVDDGCYLPLSFVSQTIRPSVAATVFFAAAEEALSPLVKDRRWKLITDKLTCIRIEIAPYAHIDMSRSTPSPTTSSQLWRKQPYKITATSIFRRLCGRPSAMHGPLCRARVSCSRIARVTGWNRTRGP